MPFPECVLPVGPDLPAGPGDETLKRGHPTVWHISTPSGQSRVPARPEVVEDDPLMIEVVAEPVPDVEAQLDEMIGRSDERFQGVMIGDSPEGLHDLLHLGPSLFDGRQPQPGTGIRLADAEDREASDPLQGRSEPYLRRVVGGTGSGATDSKGQASSGPSLPGIRPTAGPAPP